MFLRRGNTLLHIFTSYYLLHALRAPGWKISGPAKPAETLIPCRSWVLEARVRQGGREHRALEEAKVGVE